MKEEDQKKLLCPKACILIHARRRPHPTGLRPLNGKVINALIKLKSSGVAGITVKHFLTILGSYLTIVI
jgi:hypothetical protein